MAGSILDSGVVVNAAAVASSSSASAAEGGVYKERTRRCVGFVDSLVGFSVLGFLSGEGQPVLTNHPLSQPTNTRASTAMVAKIPPMQPPSQLD